MSKTNAKVLHLPARRDLAEMQPHEEKQRRPRTEKGDVRSEGRPLVCSPREKMLIEHFAQELGLSWSSYVIMAAIRYGMHLPRRLPLATALQLGVLRGTARRTLKHETGRMIEALKIDLSGRGESIPVGLQAGLGDKLAGLLRAQGAPLPDSSDNPDHAEMPSLYDFAREIREDIRPRKGEDVEKFAARIEELLSTYTG